MGVFVQARAQVSVQQPLCDQWMTQPIAYDSAYQRALEADYKAFLDPMASRRMGKILKRAIATSCTVVAQSGIAQPDAIITGTGLGCLENTEKFLAALANDGESFLQPTFFINSTHNTISSHIAVHLHCHGYNNTYVHGHISFESALLDAFMQFQLGRIHSALVGGHDEMTPDLYRIFQRTGLWQNAMASETAVSFMLADTRTPQSMAEIKGIEIMCHPSENRMHQAREALCRQAGMDPQTVVPFPVASIRTLFGHSFTASAYDLYAAVAFLQAGKAPAYLIENRDHYGDNASLILVSR